MPRVIVMDDLILEQCQCHMTRRRACQIQGQVHQRTTRLGSFHLSQVRIRFKGIFVRLIE